MYKTASQIADYVLYRLKVADIHVDIPENITPDKLEEFKRRAYDDIYSQTRSNSIFSGIGGGLLGAMGGSSISAMIGAGDGGLLGLGGGGAALGGILGVLAGQRKRKRMAQQGSDILGDMAQGKMPPPSYNFTLG